MKNNNKLVHARFMYLFMSLSFFVISACFAVAWVMNGFWWVVWIDSTRSLLVSFRNGRLSCWIAGSRSAIAGSGNGWQVGHQNFALDPWPDFLSANALGGVCVPIWLFSVACLSIGIMCYRRWKRYQRRIMMRCEKCGYSLEGLDPSALCPECGNSCYKSGSEL
jgi:hypothetical protein